MILSAPCLAFSFFAVDLPFFDLRYLHYLLFDCILLTLKLWPAAISSPVLGVTAKPRKLLDSSGGPATLVESQTITMENPYD